MRVKRSAAGYRRNFISGSYPIVDSETSFFPSCLSLHSFDRARIWIYVDCRYESTRMELSDFHHAWSLWISYSRLEISMLPFRDTRRPSLPRDPTLSHSPVIAPFCGFLTHLVSRRLIWTTIGGYRRATFYTRLRGKASPDLCVKENAGDSSGA